MLPIYNALIENWDEGIMNISLVDAPAVESNFVAFEKDKVFQSYSVENEEQHIINGCLMRANFLIYRRDERMGEFYIKYEPQTIKLMAEKLMADGFQNNVNIMHMPNSNVDGVQMLELYIKDTEKGINPKGFEDIEDGSLFASFKVHNEVIWNAIKDGTFKGYSLEGCFSVKQETKFNKTNKQNFMSSIKEKLARLLAEYGSVTAENGTVIEYEGDALEVGVAVNVEDGEYVVEDKIYVVTEGKVAEIKDVEPIEEPTAEEIIEETVEAEEETETVEEPKEEEAPIAEEPTEETPNEVETLKAEIEALKSEIEAIKSQIEEIVTKPVAEPIEEAFEKIEAVDENRWERFNRLMKK